jgi:TRAP-type C4-dicarboxylate transport system substrate-binding protein
VCIETKNTKFVQNGNMYSEAKKIHIAEAVLKVSSNDVLDELEAVLKKAAKKPAAKKISAHQFSGLLTKKDATLMEKAIKDGCETIHADDWK